MILINIRKCTILLFNWGFYAQTIERIGDTYILFQL